jgi:hypothetical protein
MIPCRTENRILLQIAHETAHQIARVTILFKGANIFASKFVSGTVFELSAHSAAELHILPGRWRHVWLVTIDPSEIWGKWTEMNATQHRGN